jgi:uncharacterized protein (UPF0335 family)
LAPCEAQFQGDNHAVTLQIISLRKKDAERRREKDELLELYKSTTGMARYCAQHNPMVLILLR